MKGDDVFDVLVIVNGDLSSVHDKDIDTLGKKEWDRIIVTVTGKGTVANVHRHHTWTIGNRDVHVHRAGNPNLCLELPYITNCDKAGGPRFTVIGSTEYAAITNAVYLSEFHGMSKYVTLYLPDGVDTELGRYLAFENVLVAKVGE